MAAKKHPAYHMPQVLREIRLHGRPVAGTDVRASALAREACRQGLAWREGMMWSRLDSAKQVASYSLTREGEEMIADDEASVETWIGSWPDWEQDTAKALLRKASK